MSHPLLLALQDKGRLFLVNRCAASALIPMCWRRSIYRASGVEIGEGGKPGLWLADCALFGVEPGKRHLRIGSDTFINHRCSFYCAAPIRIGARCNIAMEVLFCTATHQVGDGSRRAGAAAGAPITVGDGCWIGARAAILPEVTIGEGCIIAAGAVVIGAACRTDSTRACPRSGSATRSPSDDAARPAADAPVYCSWLQDAEPCPGPQDQARTFT